MNITVDLIVQLVTGLIVALAIIGVFCWLFMDRPSPSSDNLCPDVMPPRPTELPDQGTLKLVETLTADDMYAIAQNNITEKRNREEEELKPIRERLVPVVNAITKEILFIASNGGTEYHGKFTDLKSKHYIFAINDTEARLLAVMLGEKGYKVSIGGDDFIIKWN